MIDPDVPYGVNGEKTEKIMLGFGLLPLNGSSDDDKVTPYSAKSKRTIKLRYLTR